MWAENFVVSIPKLLDNEKGAEFTLLVLVEVTLEASMVVVDARGQVLGR